MGNFNSNRHELKVETTDTLVRTRTNFNLGVP